MGVNGSEDAEGVILMVSDWLELDAADSWVRHDSEIVSVRSRCQCLKALNPRRGRGGFPQKLEPTTWLTVTLPGSTTGAFLRFILGRANRNLSTPSQSQSGRGLRARHQHLPRAHPLHAIFHPASHL